MDKNTYNRLSVVNQLEAGDILLTQVFSFKDSEGKLDSDRVLIRGGQAVFSHVQKGSANSEHASIVYVRLRTNGTPETMRIDSHNGRGGITLCKLNLDDFHLVYRCSESALALCATIVAGKLAGIAEDGGENITHGKYSIPSAILSPFRTKLLGPGGKKYLESIKKIVEAPPDKPVKAPNMFCSEFATSCYEVAGLLMDQKPLFGADPRAITAKALHALLEKHPKFELRGRYPSKTAS